jgi:uncharacterized protein (TIGR02271 family)
MQTIVATFDSRQTAQRAVNQLISQGFSRTNVHLEAADLSNTTAAAAAPQDSDKGFMAEVEEFFSHLFGGGKAEPEAGTYAEAVRRGGAVVAVDAKDEADLSKAKSVMQTLGPVDVDARAAQWKSKGWTGFDRNCKPLSHEEMALERQSVPIVQEELQVGKRTTDVGGLRVVKRMTETPVSEIVKLRQERATVERRPVNREATEADFSNFKEGSVELRDTAEEAVVGKTARVVEEVLVGKKVSERTEKVSDTVRRTNVDVERVGGQQEQSKGKSTWRE